jgi:hypothetical protein
MFVCVDTYDLGLSPLKVDHKQKIKSKLKHGMSPINIDFSICAYHTIQHRRFNSLSTSI